MSDPRLSGDPQWYKDAIIYELHIKSFFDGNNDGIGDFEGLIQKLDYLQSLGVTCLWLLPFYPSPLRDDGYDIADYGNIHPSYGTLKDFSHFISEAHRRGLRVVTELVINHTSDQHPWFQAARRAPAGSAKRDYYVWSDTDTKYKDARIIFRDFEKSNWTWDPIAKAYYWHRFFHHQPDLNFDNPHVLQAIIKVMRFWLDMGVDGVRLDAIPYLIERDGTNCENLAETHVILKKMRKELDERYKDRMFLAEANQWPSDVRAYFGEGDECHMAFHFPVMPRMFMAVRQEDRHPITDILRQTPDIPESCQWALFLRNHDELTLEMVTDEERDYMYKEYATNPIARLNLGIRRRLAPLLENSRRRLELMNSLLLSFPGTPIIYYGDEIGMGDNIYLGDRNGVRTPMQWSSDRNAGFSRADFAQLYAPPVMDSVYGYQSVNVESQLKEPSSMLNWTKRMIALRKSYQVFGRGTLEFISPTNRKVICYVRRYQDDILLAVANLSRFVQPAELNLTAFEGLVPTEMLGGVEFPPIGKLPYFITLGPHGFYWFLLQPKASRLPPIEAGSGTADKVLVLGTGETALFQERARRTLETQALPAYFAAQPWFKKDGDGVISKVRLIDWGVLQKAPFRAIALARVTLASGSEDIYLLPLGLGEGEAMDTLRFQRPSAMVMRFELAGVPGWVYDTFTDDLFCRQLYDLMEKQGSIPLQRGRLTGQNFPGLHGLRAEGDSTATEIVRLPNDLNSIRYGKNLLLKVYRKIEPGIRPDVEVSRMLTERAGYDRTPKVGGALSYEGLGNEPAVVGLLQGWLSRQSTAWDFALEELSRYFETISSRVGDLGSLGESQRVVTPQATSQPPAGFLEVGGAWWNAAAVLGKRTAEMHAALARDEKDPDFAPVPLKTADLRRQFAHSRRRVEAVIEKLSAVPESCREIIQHLPESLDALESKLRKLPPVIAVKGRQRIHGFFRLDQVLWANNDFLFQDLDGDPEQPLVERRPKTSPLEDLATMLRSFHAAIYVGLNRITAVDRPDDFARLQPAGRLLFNHVATAFLSSYRTTLQASPALPADDGIFHAVLDVYTWERLAKELEGSLHKSEISICATLEAAWKR